MGAGGSSTKESCKRALLGAERGKDREDALLAQFKAWDKDGNGEIPVKELAALLTELNPSVKWSKLLAHADIDQDGSIDFEELVSWTCSSPHLREYFQVWGRIETSRTKETYGSIKAFQEDRITKRKLKEVLEDVNDRHDTMVQEQLPSLIEKSFDHHDKDGSGVLEKSESVIFFSNYVALLQNHWISVARSIARENVENMESLLSMEKKIKRMVDEYEKDAEERHRNAFKFIDRDGSKRLEKHEVVRALSDVRMDSKRPFLRILGLNFVPGIHGSKAPERWDD
eukprot:TRINITY_DN6252_c0_g2_i1.p1 TRINITY_DN6252_c0_g2~~TRINITY_DN6252_c0_g2_i1.p1  ORF type:complete len:284 (-),score=69.97 TRINITY_DN6252_c0_g2_i1:112-963(-)